MSKWCDVGDVRAPYTTYWLITFRTRGYLCVVLKLFRRSSTASVYCLSLRIRDCMTKTSITVDYDDNNDDDELTPCQCTHSIPFHFPYDLKQRKKSVVDEMSMTG